MTAADVTTDTGAGETEEAAAQPVNNIVVATNDNATANNHIENHTIDDDSNNTTNNDNDTNTTNNDNDTNRNHPNHTNNNNDDDSRNSNNHAGSQGMGIQSQHRKSHTKNRKKTAYQQVVVAKHKELKGQLTIRGQYAFDAYRDCCICVAERYNRKIKRSHHRKCPRNRDFVQARNKITLAQKRYERMQRQMSKKFAGTAGEFSSTNVTPQSIQKYFEPRVEKRKTTDGGAESDIPAGTSIPARPDIDSGTTPVVNSELETAAEMVTRQMEECIENLKLEDEVHTFPTICKCIATTMAEGTFRNRMKKLASNSNATVAPMAMQAFARYVSKMIPRVVQSSGSPADTSISRMQMAWFNHFVPRNKMSITIPNCVEKETKPDPIYTSIEGQQLLLVEWKIFFNGIKLSCPLCPYGELVEGWNTHTKSNTLFPIFGVSGPPKWAILFKYRCNCCKEYIDSNDGRLIRTLPAHVAQAFPVETKFAQPKSKWHLDNVASDLFDALMGGYGNGNMFSKNILYPSIVKEHSRRAEVYYSKCQVYLKKWGNRDESSPDFVKCHGEYITCYPPDGAALRKLHSMVLRTPLTKSGISDYEQCTREIQSVSTSKMVIQDHTCEVTKNYVDRKKLGNLKYCWTCATETGEIACAVMVPSSAAIDLSHAAQSLARRPGFQPKILYSDTWPHGADYWKCVFGEHLRGRLGMFHFLQRIVRTLRQAHTDYIGAVADLCSCIYRWEKDSYNSLLKAFQDGHFPAAPKTSNEIHQLQFTKSFKRNYSKFLMKELFPTETVRHNLQNWFA